MGNNFNNRNNGNQHSQSVEKALEQASKDAPQEEKPSEQVQESQEISNVSGTVQETAKAPVENTSQNASAAVKAAPAETKVTFESYIEAINESGSELAKYASQFMATYVDNMAINKPMELANTKMIQVSLWKNLINVLKTNTEDFKQSWDVVSAFIKKNREGVFSDSFAFRQVTVLNISDDDRKAFVSILTLLLASADVVNKADLSKMLDLNKVLTSPSFTDTARAHLVEYYMS